MIKDFATLKHYFPSENLFNQAIRPIMNAEPIIQLATLNRFGITCPAPIQSNLHGERSLEVAVFR